MRAATVVLTWDGLQVHPVDDLFERAEGLAVEAIRYVGPVHEGRYVQLLELRGDLDRARSLLADSPDVVECSVAGDGGRGIAYLQCRTAGIVESLLAALHEHEIVLDWPMRYVETEGSRGIQLTVIGTDRAIRRAAAELPEGVHLRLERMGEYEPDTGRLSSVLTDRQVELFELAVREGYYEVPRRTTHRALADDLGLATGTVSERLQRIEARLVAAYVE